MTDRLAAQQLSLEDAIDGMNRAMRALALELPQEVWTDVADRYESLKWAVASAVAQAKEAGRKDYAEYLLNVMDELKKAAK